MTALYYLIPFLCSAGLLYWVYQYFCCFGDGICCSRKTASAAYLAGFPAIWLISLPEDSALRSLLTLFLCLFFSCFHRMKWLHRFLSAALLWLTLCSIDQLLVYLSAKGSLFLFAAYSFSSSIGSILFVCLTQTVLLTLCALWQFRVRKNFVLLQWIPGLCLPVSLSFLCALALLFEINQNDRRFHFRNIEFLHQVDQPDLLFYLSCAGLLALNILIPYLCQRMLDLKNAQKEKNAISEQNLYFQNQFALLRSSTKEIRSLRHDMRNHLAAIRAMIDPENQEASQYLNVLLGDFNVKHEISSTGNLLLDSLVNYKFQNAPADNLEISYHASVPEDLPFNAWDLTVILGNLIDNAVEAAAECPKGGRKINLALESLHNCLTIEISNTFTGERFPHKDGYLTTKEAAGDHGFGLENIRRTVEKNDGTFSCGQKDGLFCARVIIPL